MDHSKLPETIIAKINDEREGLCVSSISALEIAIKYEKEKLLLPCSPVDWFSRAIELLGLQELPIRYEVAALSASLPKIHNDPFDRLLVATAIKYQLTLLTPDTHIHAYPDLEWMWATVHA